MPSPVSSARGRRSALRRRADDNVAVVSNGQHVPTPMAAAARRATASKAACDLDFSQWLKWFCEAGGLT